MNITDEWVRAVAPNAAAVRNGQALARRFSALRVSPDAALLSGDCQGSGSTPYTAWADLTAPETPLFRCTCPSRQKPCKHVLGLLLAFRLSPDSFTSGLIEGGTPPRGRKEPSEPAQMTLCLGDAPPVPAAEPRERALSRIEGLDLARRLAASLAAEGLGAQDAGKLAELRARAKALGRYHIPGVQTAFARALRALGEDNAAALAELAVFHSLCAKAKAYYIRKQTEPECLDAALETWCGRVWHSPELARMGLAVPDARLIQLAFTSRDDPVTGELEDTGYWALLSGKQAPVCLTRTLRPRHAAAHMREADSCFDIVKTPALYRYPSGLRVRWDEFTLETPSPGDYAAVLASAETLSSAARRLREALRDPLGLGLLPAVVRMDAIETAGGRFWLACEQDRLPLADAPDAPVSLVPLLLDASHKAAFVRLRTAPDGHAFGEVLSLISDTGITRVGG